MTIEIPTYIIGYFLISFLSVKPIKWFWKWLEGPHLNKNDKEVVALLSFFWPVGIPFCILIAIITLFGKIYSYLVGGD